MKQHQAISNRRGIITAFAVAIVSMTVLGFSNISVAQSSYTWNGGGGDNNFGTGANWVGGNAPSSLQSYLHFAGSTRLSPNNNYGDYSGGFQFLFDSGASAFTITGNHIKFYDYGGVYPKIENDSSSLQTINFGFGSAASGKNMDITAANGNLTFGSSFSYFDDVGVYLAVHANTSHTVTFNGAIGNGAASAKFSLDSGGICVFGAGNSYTGESDINAGELQITSSGAIASGSAIYLGLGTTTALAQMTLTGNGSQTFANSFTVNSLLGSTSDHTKRIIASSNTSGSDTYSGTITLNSDISMNAENSGGGLIFSGEVGVNAYTAYATGPGTVTLNGSVDNLNLGLTVNSGTVVLDKTGSGHHAVGTSLTVNSSGTVQLGSGGNSDQIYDGAGVTINSGGAFDLNGQTETINSISLNGTGINGLGALTNSSSTASTLILNNASTLAGATTIGGTGDITIGGSGAITATSITYLTKIGSNTITLTNGGGLDNLNVHVVVNSGTVILAKTGTSSSPSVHATGQVTINTNATVQLSGSGGYEIYDGQNSTNLGGVLDLNGQNQTFTGTGSLTINGTGIGSGGSLINSSGTASTIGGTNVAGVLILGSNSSIGGSGNLTIAGVIAGGFSLSKVGLGTFTLSSNNTYTGGTTISAGTLLVNNTGGSGTGSGTVTVNSGATLGGNGSISNAVTVNSGGTISPGVSGAASIGTLTWLNAAPVFSGTNYLEINNAVTPNADKVVLNSGTLAYGGTLVVANIGGTLASGNSFTIFSAPAFSGYFSTVTLPTLASGLSWDTNTLKTSGILNVYSFTTTALSLSTPTNTAALISSNKLANHVSSSLGTPVAVSATTPSHGTASIDGSYNLTYTPATGYAGSDSFILTFSDGHGTQTMAVSVTVGSGTGTSPNVLSAGMVGGNFVVSFAGIPGDTYTVETNSLGSGSTWKKFGTTNVTVPASGIFQISDPVGSSSLFYRTVYPSY